MARPRKRQPNQTIAQFNAERERGKRSRKKDKFTLTIDSPITPKALTLRKSYDKETIALRNVAIRIVSDFISEELSGFGKKLTKAQEKLFATPKAAPDAITNTDVFEKTTGIRISQTELIKDQAATAFFETKVKGIGKGEEIEITSSSIGRNTMKEQYQAIERVLERDGTKNVTEERAVKLLFAPGFEKTREALITQTKQKFENFLLFSVVDTDKKPKQEFLFSPAPLKNVKFDEKYLNQFFKIRFRGAKYSSADIKKAKERGVDLEGVIQRFRVSITPKPELFNSFPLRPITEKVLATQNKANFKVSKEFDKYIQRRIKELSATPTTPAKIDKILGFLLAFSDEFKEGGLTPLNFLTRIQTPKIDPIPGFNVIVNQTRKTRAQRFISGAQITALVQRRLGEKMPKGPLRGPPLSDEILTERTGRFRRSVTVIANYRNNIMRFFYNPIYEKFIGTERDPDQFVGETIREVVAGLYSRKFAIVRQ